jgi:hypothetical protein
MNDIHKELKMIQLDDRKMQRFSPPGGPRLGGFPSIISAYPGGWNTPKRVESFIPVNH